MPAHLLDNRQRAAGFMPAQLRSSCLLRHMIRAGELSDQHMSSHMISDSQSPDHCMIAT